MECSKINIRFILFPYNIYLKIDKCISNVLKVNIQFTHVHCTVIQIDIIQLIQILVSHT